MGCYVFIAAQFDITYNLSPILYKNPLLNEFCLRLCSYFPHVQKHTVTYLYQLAQIE